MKIAVVHELHHGGARRAVNEFSKHMKKQHTVDLYLIDEYKNNSEKIFYSSVTFFCFLIKKWNGGNPVRKVYKDTIELFKRDRLHKFIAAEIDSKRYDVVVVHPSQYTQSPFILRHLKTKSIYYCQEPLRLGYEPVLKHKWENNPIRFLYEVINRNLRKKIDRYNARCADEIIAGSSYIQKVIKEIYTRDSTVCTMGVDTKVFHPKNVKKEYDILFIGSLEELGGYPLLSEVLSLLNPSVKVKLLVGAGDWITDDQELNLLYAKSKMYVALMHNESFGMIPLEAMACEVPVIAVNEGGYKETVLDGVTGYLVKRDPKEIAHSIQQLLDSEKLWIELGTNAREHVVDNFTWEKKSAEFLRIIS